MASSADVPQSRPVLGHPPRLDRHPAPEGRRPITLAAHPTSSRTTGLTTSLDEPPVLVATKLHPPRVRDAWVHRPALHARLDAGADKGLTLVACPAGYGKTTLLATWYATAGVDRPLAWLTLDAGDNDPVVLWSYLVDAVGRVCARIGRAVPPRAPGETAVSESHLARLVNALDDQPGLGLVLDDFHTLTSAPARDTIAWLVTHAPATFQLVIATRRDPELPLPALRAHDDLLELRADDLRFTAAEADTLLNQHEQLALDRADVELLVDRTDGWPAGLTLAALSLRRLQDRHGFVDRFGASHRHVLDFLETEALAAHDLADQELMIRCSVLDELTGPACDAVLGTTGTEQHLRRLAHQNLFLQPHDELHDQGTYRFHPLFAQLLRMHLHRRGPDVARALHRRAYTWYAQHGPTRTAVDHAIDAGLFDEASALVTAGWVDEANTGRAATVLGWLDRFPPEHLDHDLHLLLVQAWARTLVGHHDDAHTTVSRIETLDIDTRTPLPDGFTSAAASLATLRAVLAAADVTTQDTWSRRAVTLEPHGSRWRPVACWTRGAALYLQGRPAEADPWFAEAVDQGETTGQWLTLASALGHRSLVAGALGHRDQQTTLAARATDVADVHGLAGTASVALLASGAALADTGRTAAALAALDHAAAVARFWSQPLPLADALLRQAQVLRTLGDAAGARHASAEARAVLAGCPDPGVLGERAPGPPRPRHRTPGGTPTLTPSELRVLAHLETGATEADIARELFVTHSTVHSHTKAIYRKLGVTTRAQAVARAAELGLLP